MSDATPMDADMAAKFDVLCDDWIRTVLIDCQQARMDAGNDTDGVMPAIVKALQGNDRVPELHLHLTVGIAALNKAVTLACDMMAKQDTAMADDYLDKLAGIRAAHVPRPKDGEKNN